MLPEQFKVHNLGGVNDLKGSGHWIVLIDRLHPDKRIRGIVASVLAAAGYKAKDQKHLPRDLVLLPGRHDDLDEAERANVILELLGERLREVFPARGTYFKGQAGIHHNRIGGERARAAGVGVAGVAKVAVAVGTAGTDGTDGTDEGPAAGGPEVLPEVAAPAKAPAKRRDAASTIPVPAEDYSKLPAELAAELGGPEPVAAVAERAELEGTITDRVTGGAKRARRVGRG